MNTENLKDEEVIIEIQNGKNDLYSFIIDRYQEKISRYINYLIKDKDKSADAIQETFIKAFVNIQSFNTKQKFSSWIYRIAHNEALNEIKKYKRETKIDEELFELGEDETIEKDFEQNEAKEMIQKCLNDIPIKYSEPITLYYIEERSYEEISDILQIPMGTVATRINRAKKLMIKICKTNQKI